LLLKDQVHFVKGDFAVYQAQEVGSPSSHLAGSERNLRDGRSDGLSNSKRAILQQDQEDEPGETLLKTLLLSAFYLNWLKIKNLYKWFEKVL